MHIDNRRYQFLLEQGQTGLSVAFDLPTQIGYDSDSPEAEGEVGKVGVAISSLEDMETLTAGLPLDQLTTSMTINATAPILLAMYVAAAKRQGVTPAQLGGTIQNDILKEYIARGTYIFPPRPSLRLITDVFAWCKDAVPEWNTISISGYHMREAGCTAAQELAFTFADAIEYVDAAIEQGLTIDDIAPRLSFFWACHSNFLEEVAKFRASRRMWARIVKERYGSDNARSQSLRFHTQTGGATLTAQQPINNAIRTAFQAMSAVLGGTQSLHTNGFDEALGLPTQDAARIALRTQQVIGYESGVTDTVDPLAGSYYVESLTHAIETGARAAAAGGFTSICPMPNTAPVNDSATVTAYIIEKARNHAVVNVFPIGAITKGSLGEELAAIGSMRNAGAVAISDDGRPVMNARVMRRAMEFARSFGMPVINHCEDLHLSAGGDMHEGAESVRLGLRGIPGCSEDVMVARDILLAEVTGARYHVAHISSRHSVAMVGFAKSKGLAVTAEATPHHLAIADCDMIPYDSNFKMKPPLRSQNDVNAVVEGIVSGAIDAIATDHAPHAGSEKMQEFEKCPFGILGLETAIGISLEQLVHSGKISVVRMVEMFTTGPARILRLNRGTLAPRAPGDVTIFSTDHSWTYDVNKSASRSRNSARRCSRWATHFSKLSAC